MANHPTSDLIGKVAYEILKPQFLSTINDPDSNGAFLALSHFEPLELKGFIKAAKSDHEIFSDLEIIFPKSTVEGADVDAEYTTECSAVSVRNKEKNGKIVITCANEEDVKESLGNKTIISTSDLTTDENAPGIWADVLLMEQSFTLSEQAKREVEAFCRAILAETDIKMHIVADYLLHVVSDMKNNPLGAMAGKHLPKIDYPLFGDCFKSVDKPTQTSQWRRELKKQQKNTYFLDKKDSNLKDLEGDTLRATLKKQEDLEDGSANKLPAKLLADFNDYIDSNGRSEKTKHLLFTHDWSQVRNLFVKEKKASSKQFHEETLKAITHSGNTPTKQELGLLEDLKKTTRNDKNVTEEVLDFFSKYRDCIEESNPKLLRSWEDWVYGKKIVCEDLLGGITQCLQIFAKDIKTSHSGNRFIKIEAFRQNTINDFKKLDKEICRYFERHFGQVDKHSNKLIRFSEHKDHVSKLRVFSDEVENELDSKKDRSNTRAAKNKREGFEFKIILCEEIHDKKTGKPAREKPLASKQILWKFSDKSILLRERGDIEALVGNRKKELSSATVLVEAAYNAVGNKGTPQPLALNDVKTFDGSYGARNEGSLVPAQNKIETVDFKLREYLREQLALGNISEETHDRLITKFEAFDNRYTSLIKEFTKDAMALNGVEEMITRYNELLNEASGVDHQTIRRSVIKWINRIGTAQVEENNRRPIVSIVCPWHPLRLEASKARRDQLISAITTAVKSKKQSYSDGQLGNIYYEDLQQVIKSSLYPELAVIWNDMDAKITTASNHTGAYSLHELATTNEHTRLATDDIAEAVDTVIEQAEEYVRLQPHERDNLSILLYNCESRQMASRIVEKLDKKNQKSITEGNLPMNCEIILTHEKSGNLQDVYKKLVSQTGDKQHHGHTEGFMSKVRVNISALTDIAARPKKGITPPADIVYCKDLFSSLANVLKWIKQDKLSHTSKPEDLFSHRWNRQVPVNAGDNSSNILLCCPNQTEAGWHYIKVMTSATSEANQLDQAENDVLIPAKSLDIDKAGVKKVISESHKLGVWVVSQDEMLDRRLLEERGVKVIRYVQSVARGRNLLISSKADDALLRVTLEGRLQSILPTANAELVETILDSTNEVSGGLILKAARRTNSTSELLGVVLSKLLVTAEVGRTSPVCWCSLDDFSQWLGKPNGDHLADLLVMVPSYDGNNQPHLKLIVTEAKYVNKDNLTENKKKSAKQLHDTLRLISKALQEENPPQDQGLWLSRISDMLLSRLTNKTSELRFSPEKWRNIVRNRDCTFSVSGSSHVFAYDVDNSAPTTGIDLTDIHDVIAQQEEFNIQEIKDLFSKFNDMDLDPILSIRRQKGHTGFDKDKKRTLKSPSNKITEIRDGDDQPQADDYQSPGKAESTFTGPGPLTPDSDRQTEPATFTLPDKESSDPDLNDQNSHIDNECLAILEQRSQNFESGNQIGEQWLTETTEELKSALRDKGMSSKLMDNKVPILTPNAAIVYFKGGPDITVKRIEDAAPEFLTTYAIDILRVTPGLGFISVTIVRPTREILHTSVVFRSFFSSDNFDPESEAIMVGVREEDGQPQMLDPFVNPHTLIAGATGSGKSVLIQSMLLYIGLTRSPEEAHIYLVDAKKGLDFSGLKKLPHLKRGSGKIIVEQDESVQTLQKLKEEMDRRYNLFADTGSTNIRDYRQKTGKRIPTIFYVQDEFTNWMLDSDYVEQISACVNSLGVMSRAAGIFMIFGLQRPDNQVMPMQLRNQLGNRLTLQVQEKGTAEIATGMKNSGAEKLLGKGHMLAKLESDTLIPIQVPFTHPDQDLEVLVNRLAKKYEQ
jgi:S-DNA-T family DNA segregation ATPase FtsK/SpoIIIE